MATKVEKWECDECEDLHDTEEEANDCSCKKRATTCGDPVVELF